MEWCHWSKINPRIVRAYIDKSGDTIRWLEEKGIIFELLPMFPNQVPLVRHAVKGRSIEVIRILRKNCVDMGAKVLTRTSGKKILRDAKGNITGVVAETKDGEITIKTGCVIITTGGYANNRNMLKKYCSYYQDSMTNDGVPSNMGDGIVMATEIGADTAGLGHMTLQGPNTDPQSSADYLNIDKMGTDGNPLKITIHNIGREPKTIWVNKQGRRFVDECYILKFFAYGNVIAEQPDGICYSLFDNKLRKIMEEQGLVMKLPRVGGRSKLLPHCPGG